MIITKATRDDLFEFSKIENDIFGEDSFGVFLLEQYLRRNIIFHKIVDPSDSKIIGFVIVVEIINVEGSDRILADFLKVNGIKTKKTAHLVNLLIRKEYWYRKIGTKLLQHVLSELEKLKFEHIKLEVNTSNSTAINLYRKFMIHKSISNAAPPAAFVPTRLASHTPLWLAT